MATLEEILPPRLTLEELQDKLANNVNSKDILEKQINMVRDSVLSIRLLFNDLLQTLSLIDQYTDKTSQEKYIMIQKKLQGLYGNLKDLVNEFQKLKPLLDTMTIFSESSEQKFIPLETLNLASESVRPLASPSYKKNTNRSNAPTPGSNVTTPSAAGSTNSGILAASQTKNHRKTRINNKRHSSGSAPTPVVVGSTNPAFPGAAPIIVSGMSPMNMVTSPLNGISPGRTSQQPHHQVATPAATLSMQVTQQKQASLPLKGTPNNTPLIPSVNLTPQSILNMSAFDVSNNQGMPMNMNNPNIVTNNNNHSNSFHGMGFPADLETLDLNTLELNSLNMDLLG